MLEGVIIKWLSPWLVKLGFQEGDLVILSDVGGDMFTIGVTDSEQLASIRKVTYADIAFGPPKYWGEMGQQISTQEECCHGTCFCELFEIPLLIAYAVQNSLDQGLDFNDPDLMTEQMRKVKQPSCNGFFFFDQTTVFRQISKIFLKQTIYKSDG